jgi:hypothetical protein
MKCDKIKKQKQKTMRTFLKNVQEPGQHGSTLEKWNPGHLCGST